MADYRPTLQTEKGGKMTQIVLLLSDGKPVLAFTDIKKANEMRKFLEAAKQKPTIVILPIYQD